MKKQITKLLTVTIFFTMFLGLNVTLIEASTTEKRTTLSRSHYEYWRYSNKPGWYVGGTEQGGTEDVRIGGSPTYTFTHTYYRGLNPGEKVKSVTIKPGTALNVNKTEFDNSKYYEYNNTSWNNFLLEEKQHTAQQASINIVGENFTGTNPTIQIKVSPKLLPEALAKNITDTATIPPNTSEGFRTLVNFIVEWEIELAKDPQVTVQHYNQRTGNKLEPDTTYSVSPNTNVTESSKSFSGVSYTNSVISDDEGKTWKLLSTNTTRNIPINKDTIIRFYYIEEGSIVADLQIFANPSKIEKDKTATVTFTLDASGSSSSTGITKYEYWFSDKKENLVGTPHQTSTSNSWTTSKSGVRPNSEWYGKVKVYSGTGKTDIAEADITIGELKPEQQIDVTAYLTLSSDDPKVINKWPGGGLITVEVPQNVIVNDKPYELEVKFDGTQSHSTNGIGKYVFDITFPIQETIVSASPVISKTMTLYPNNNIVAKLTTHDSGDESKTATHTDELLIDLVAKVIPPDVKLEINKRTFFYKEKAIFTPILKNKKIALSQYIKKNGKLKMPQEKLSLTEKGKFLKSLY